MKTFKKAALVVARLIFVILLLVGGCRAVVWAVTPSADQIYKANADKRKADEWRRKDALQRRMLEERRREFDRRLMEEIMRARKRKRLLEV